MGTSKCKRVIFCYEKVALFSLMGVRDLVGLVNRQIAQQVGINLVAGPRLRRARPAVQSLDAHALHQGRDMFTANHEAILAQHVPKHTGSGKGVLQMQSVDLSHQLQVIIGNRSRQIVHAATTDPDNLGLLADGQRMVTVNHFFALSNPALVSAPSIKSFSRVN